MALEKYIVQEGQNLYDVVLLKYGTLDNIFTIFVDNASIDINTDLQALDELLIDTEVVGDNEIKGQYIRTTFITNNADADFIPFIDTKQFNDLVPFDFNDTTPYDFN